MTWRRRGGVTREQLDNIASFGNQTQSARRISNVQRRTGGRGLTIAWGGGGGRLEKKDFAVSVMKGGVTGLQSLKDRAGPVASTDGQEENSASKT